MDVVPLQRRIYFLTFVDSLSMIFSQYTETCEVIIDDPKIGGDDIEDYLKNDVRNLCMQILMYTVEYLLLSSQWME